MLGADQLVMKNELIDYFFTRIERFYDSVIGIIKGIIMRQQKMSFTHQIDI